jgi:hypothetical protein
LHVATSILVNNGKKKDRRSFLQKAALTGAGAFVMPKLGFAAKANEFKREEKMIMNITALGFQW